MGLIGTTRTRRATQAMVSSDDHLATTAGLSMLLAGGSAVDAAMAANAVLTVTYPHACGLGGDLFALVHDGHDRPHALMAAGRAGSGADPDRLRAEGHTAVPLHGDIRSVTVPGCADGWSALHDRFGRLGLDEVLAPAIRHALEGFPPSAELASATGALGACAGIEELLDATGAPARRGLVRRPGAGRVLADMARAGRAGVYEGHFGAALVELAAGEITATDVSRQHAEWVDPISVRAFGHHLWAPPPVSQAYVAQSAWWIMEGLALPDDPASPAWPHLLAEALLQSAFDRRDVLHEAADGAALLAPDRLAPRRGRISPDRAASAPGTWSPGSTTYLCAVDGDGMAVSLIQSNASSFGSRLFVPGTGVALQNRGIGFSLESGHPAEYGPGRRPPHTLSPFLVLDDRHRLKGLLGTRGADAQPQVVLQILSRIVGYGASPGSAVGAARWLLTGAGANAFDTWNRPDEVVLKLEAHSPTGWAEGLRDRGHQVSQAGPGDTVFGSAHTIWVEDDVLAGAADPRTGTASAAGF